MNSRSGRTHNGAVSVSYSSLVLILPVLKWSAKKGQFVAAPLRFHFLLNNYTL